MVEFGGWYMPVQYTNVIDEHNTTRKCAGLFDISHMGEFRVTGKNAKKFLQYVMINDLDKIENNKTQYNMMCYETGGIVDDLLIYRANENEYMIVVNASNIKKDFEWLKEHKIPGVKLQDISNKTSKLDLQGPNSQIILQKICQDDLSKIKRFYFLKTKINKFSVLISRTGYTGEDGFEIYCDNKNVVELWKILLKKGFEYGIKPIGLGARDTLRIEACYSLYGHEINSETSPIQASIGWAVRTYKNEFIGKNILRKQKNDGTNKINVAFEMLDRAIAREHYKIYNHDIFIGKVTSGTYSPTFKKSIGMALVLKEYSEPDSLIDIKIRDKTYTAKIIKKPFYKFRGGK